MPSVAYGDLENALGEVVDLQRGNPTPTGSSLHDPALTRVIGRASVVLLSSHFERYLYAVNDEAAHEIGESGVASERLPETLRLLHSASAIDALSITQWSNRATQLAAFVEGESWLWRQGATGVLDASRLLAWMRAPHPDDVVRYYRYWGIHDIFRAITRTPHTLRDLRLRLGELVSKRNGIAHGDFAVEATQEDVRLYRAAVRTFGTRADRALAQSLARLTGTVPW